MIVITFYSFKGGVGRSMALANVAELLAAKGRKVVLCDFDLEAPGIERFAVDDEDTALAMRSWPGVMDLLLEYKEAVVRANPVSETVSVDDGQFQLVGGSLRLRRPSSYARVVREYESIGGQIRLLPAGRRDGEHQRKYASDVQSFDWNEFYEKWEGAAYLNFFRQDLASSGADVLLIDSRTGVTEQSGVCTHDLADVVVLLCAASDQNLSGTQWMAATLSRPELVDARGGRPLDVLVMAARVDQRAEVKHLGEFRSRFAELFDRYAHAWGIAGVRSEKKEIPYIAHYAFRERVVSRDIETTQRGAEGMLDAYRLLSECLERRLKGPLPEVEAIEWKPPPDLEHETVYGGRQAPMDVVHLRSLLEEAEARSATLARDLAAANERTADASRLADEAKARAVELTEELEQARTRAERAVEDERRTGRRMLVRWLSVPVVLVAVLSVSAVGLRAHILDMQAESALLRSTLDSQLRSATQNLTDKARAARQEAEQAWAAAEQAEAESKAKSNEAQKLYLAAQEAAKQTEADFLAAAKRADEAKSLAEQARLVADAAQLAKRNATQAANEAESRAADAERDATQARADRDVARQALDIARQALDSERAARSQVEARLAVETSAVQKLQQDLARCTSQLVVCREPVADEIKGSKSLK